MPIKLAPERKQYIAIEVLKTIIPRAEAADPVRGLQRKLSRDCAEAGSMLEPEDLVGKLIPAIGHVLRSGTVSDVEARAFIVDVVGEIVGISGTQSSFDMIVLYGMANCAAPSRSTSMHRHKCPKCEKIWEHASTCGGIDEAHKCPVCGTLQLYQYFPTGT